MRCCCRCCRRYDIRPAFLSDTSEHRDRDIVRECTAAAAAAAVAQRDLLFTVSVFCHAKPKVETCYFFRYPSSASTPSIRAAEVQTCIFFSLYKLCLHTEYTRCCCRCYHRSYVHLVFLSSPIQVSSAATAVVVGVVHTPARS